MRASARAAALSDAMSSRCSRSSTRDLLVRAQVGRRRAQNVAADDHLRVEVGLVLEEHAAVITLVMLAMDRWICEFSSQST